MNLENCFEVNTTRSRVTSSKQEKKASRRVLSAGLDFHNHSGASSPLSVRRFNRKCFLKIQSFFCTCQPVGAESNVKTDGSRLVKGQGVAGSKKKKRGTILCMDVLSLSTQLSFQCSDRYNTFSPGKLPTAVALPAPLFCSPPAVKSEVDKAT